MTTAALLVLMIVAVPVGVWVALPQCDHLDADGQSVLMWTADPLTGRVRGQCPHCYRHARVRRRNQLTDVNQQ